MRTSLLRRKCSGEKLYFSILKRTNVLMKLWEAGEACSNHHRSVYRCVRDLTRCQKWYFASCLPLETWSVSGFAAHCSPEKPLADPHLTERGVFQRCLLKMIQNGIGPKGKNISLLYYSPLSDEKSAATGSHWGFNERAWWRENGGSDGTMTDSFYFTAAGCPSVTRPSAG